MNIKIPIEVNCPELLYIMKVIFSVFLGVEYKLTLADVKEITVVGTKQNLIIPTTFFSSTSCQNKSLNDIPKAVDKDIITIGEQDFDIVSIYGRSSITRSESEIILHSDILASTFFMLSRWEEYIDKTRDGHGRFLAKSSLAYKAKFIDRPIVNEYVELLWVLLQKIGINQKRKIRSYKLVPTHDVDKPYLMNGFAKSLRYIAGSLKRRRFSELGRYAKKVIERKDPFDTHDLLMDMAEVNNSEAHFFFLQKGKSKQDETHDISTAKIKGLAKHIKERGHNIGYHPSYDAFEDENLFQKEKKYLEDTFEMKVNSGRHHFLRFDVSTTWSMWANQEMAWDSTVGYADRAGFRCGVCYPFPTFDIINKKQLSVYERPLIIMEWSLIHYQGLNIEASEEYIQKLKTEVKKYNGEFVFLYHNSAFFTDDYLHLSQRLLKSFYN